MMVIRAIRATKDNTKPFGTLACLKDYPSFSGPGWDCWMTEGFAANQKLKLHICQCNSIPPYQVVELKQSSGQNVIICPEEPILIMLAERCDSIHPQAKDVKVLILEPCEILTVQPGVWYDVCRGIDHAITYCVLSGSDPTLDNRASIEGGPIAVEV